ncbi:hypothetical protein Cgig2_021229 [Carnegiea gigantea]|uniref:Protein FAR1-RELATED SEQUENCE n=1 Tax=Carnegiea gigantea TaxID=171969 RepID=A0A9Q1KWB4_9CARY|nr:hypothetical protein Cgig2_021229 [Carnegiea gigantea]
MREKWCPAFSKQFFSGSVLSSQRSETTNKSSKRRLWVTADLCDFYNIFYDVVSEWRSKDNGEDHRCSKGNVEMAFPSINILKHAMSVYTTEVFLMFEKEFIDGVAYNFKAIESSSSAMSFEVWGIRVARESHGEESHEFRHIINFNKEEGVVECSCSVRAVKRRKLKKLSKNNVGSSTAPSQNGSCVSDAPPHTGISDSQVLQQGSFPLSSFHPPYYFHLANSSSVFMPVMALPVLQQLHSNVIHANDSHNDKP